MTSVIHKPPYNSFLCSSDQNSIMLVNPKKALNFDELWRDQSARDVDSFSLVRPSKLAQCFLVLKYCNSLTVIDDSLSISVGKRYGRQSLLYLILFLKEYATSYLFVHPDLKDEKPTLDDYWKGMVENIRIYSDDDNPLVQVRWFWTKDNIKEALRGMRVDPKLHRYV